MGRFFVVCCGVFLFVVAVGFVSYGMIVAYRTCCFALDIVSFLIFAGFAILDIICGRFAFGFFRIPMISWFYSPAIHHFIRRPLFVFSFW